VLVTGTLVYGKGDEEGEKEELTEALAAASAVEETPPAAAVAGGAAPVLIPSGAVGAVGATAEPIPVRASFKSTMTMVTGSYSRSFTQRGSYRGGSFVGTGPRPHFPDVQ
jgi:hypothetical protein